MKTLRPVEAHDVIDGKTVSMSSRKKLAVALAALFVCVACNAAAPAAQATFGVSEFSGEVPANQAGDPATQAGSHPYSATATIMMNTGFDSRGNLIGDGGQFKDVEVALPPGFVGNPSATPTKCATIELLRGVFFQAACPASSQVGTVRIFSANSGNVVGPLLAFFTDIPVYNMVPPRGAPAALGFTVGTPILLVAEVRTGGDYGVTIASRAAAQALRAVGSRLTVWGVPADPSHDALRVCQRPPLPPLQGCSTDAPQKPFLSLPVDCSAGPLTTRLRVDSWLNPGAFETASFDHDVNGVPMAVEGCGKVAFDPDISVQPTSTRPDSPTGLEVNLTLPQSESPDGLAQAHLKRAVVTLPEGMSINPSAADGLAACSDAQLDLNGAGPSLCPPASKVGTVRVETPLLDEALEGGVYVRAQNSDDPASGEMFRIAIVIDSELRGVRVKLAGRVVADPVTGRLVTTFDDNPQIPFSKLSLRLKDGPRAPLANPSRCGTQTVKSEFSSWSVADPDNPTPAEVVTKSSSFTIPCPGQTGFEPAFEAGSVSPTGGAFSPFVARIDRSDRQQFLSGVSVDLPKGLVANLRGVPLCSDVQATNGGCPEGSRIGTATVGAGSGSNPFYLQGPVYLTEGYRGGPYGLSAQVDVKAGPFDLGTVIVRQAIYVDPVTAELRVVSDALPQIVKGVPARLRSVNVDVDRPNFTINPTSCAEKRVGATLTSIDGGVHKTGSRFQAGDCQALSFRPKLAMRLTGKGRTRTGAHPGLKTILTQPVGQANIARAQVALPKSVVLDPRNSTDPALVCDYDKGQAADCPASSIIGKATARTPLLNQPLTGNVHLVQGIRFGPSGNRIRTTPTLLVKLRGEVSIDLRARTTVKGNRLVTVFDQVPDARVSKFSLNINGGSKGILVITRTARSNINVCNGKQLAAIKTDGQNGRRADFNTRIKTPCTKKARKTKRNTKK